MSVPNTQTTSGLSNLIMSYYEKVLLDKLLVKFHFDKFGKKKTLAKNQGKTVTWNRFANIADSVTPLTESETPSGTSMSTSQIVATLAQYGQYVACSDHLELTAINPMIEEMVENLGYAAGKSMDALTRNEVDTNGTQQYANDGSGSNSSAADVQAATDAAFGSDEVRRAVKALRAADVDEWEDGLFRSIIHPYQEFDLLGESSANTLIQLVSLTDKSIAERGLIGAGWGVKFFRSSHIRVNSAPNTNVYKAVILGKNAYGLVDLESAGLEILVKDKKSGGTEDPLEQRSTVGYKFTFVPKILDANRIIVVNSYAAA